MILITSGAYLGEDFTSEVGLIPPSFLPIGNKRLFEYQVSFLKSCYKTDGDYYLSVPKSYDIDHYDYDLLSALGVKIIETPVGLSLGESISFCWNSSSKNHEYLTILHGDTLFLEATFTDLDIITVHPNEGLYKRGYVNSKSSLQSKYISDWTDSDNNVISGFFNFSKPFFFMKALVESNNDFLDAIAKYSSKYCLRHEKSGKWLDLGHVNSFFKARAEMTTQRSFNELKISKHSVKKSSLSASKKIVAEANWFHKLPMSLRYYTPSLLSKNDGNDAFEGASYELEYMYNLPLSDLMVFSKMPGVFWDKVFFKISEMLEEFNQYKPIENSKKELKKYDQLYLPKTMQRLSKYAELQGKKIDDLKYFISDNQAISLAKVAEDSAKFINETSQKDLCLSHGDLCFSNILYDPRSESLKCVDPRGIDNLGNFSIYSDRRYDLAKLYHSVRGLYDYIIAGRFKIERNSPKMINLKIMNNFHHQENLINSFNKFIFSGLDYSEEEILAITIHLFLSMLPLHSDRPERQEAFIVNALNLYQHLLEVKK